MARAPDVVAPPEGNPRFPLLDGLRGCAALAVVAFHAAVLADPGAQTVPGRWLGHLDVGVTVFFLLTGFLLYRPLRAAAAGKAPEVPTWLFYWRRLLRIVPAYWGALLVLAPLLQFAQPDGLPDILFLQVYRPLWARTGIGPAWSICVELSFYLVLPVLAAMLAAGLRRVRPQRRSAAELAILGALAIGSLTWRAVLARAGAHPYLLDPLPGTMSWFCLGMAMAVVSLEPAGWATRTRAAVAAHPSVCWAAALLLYAALVPGTEGGTFHGREHGGISVFVCYALIAGLVLAPLVYGSELRGAVRPLRSRGMVWLGLVSYGIYLYHFPLMEKLSEHWRADSRTLTLLAYFAVGAALAIACGAVSYVVVERPVLRFKHPERLRRALASATSR